MQAFARNQPVTTMVGAVRSLALGDGADEILGYSTSYFVGRSLIWGVALAVVFAPITVARFRGG